MMKRIVVSGCLGFMPCRYDGRVLNVRRIKTLAGRARLVPVCPEEAIGLGTPRKKIRLVRTRHGIRLIQPSTGTDLTAQMRSFARAFLKKTGKADGLILKKKSPSCGIGDVKVYSSAKSRKTVGRGTGIFAAEILKTKGVQYVQCI